jgi:hypothetical protein
VVKAKIVERGVGGGERIADSDGPNSVPCMSDWAETKLGFLKTVSKATYEWKGLDLL